ncbi:hypothetical protein EVAR_19989_1 [Eumeta japonica]|uniref:Uncharacterized protein n=1 Tax=Eumeta variegata TaxID=151549 RepID=A0A4C1VA02_EUMVA|nr:hypothetical protein EVAR_19989_1 [Eumeta japonica]
MSDIRIKSETELEIDVDRYKRRKNSFYTHANGAADINHMRKPPTRQGRTTSAGSSKSYQALRLGGSANPVNRHAPGNVSAVIGREWADRWLDVTQIPRSAAQSPSGNPPST